MTLVLACQSADVPIPVADVRDHVAADNENEDGHDDNSEDVLYKIQLIVRLM